MTNPYQPPSEDADTHLPEDDYSYTLASQSQRLIHLFVDSVAVTLLSVFLGQLPLAASPFDPTGMLITFGYYFGFEATLGRTPGKLVTGTAVIDVNGGPAGVRQIFGRTLARFFPFEALSFLGRGHGWHDRWSGTRVVRLRK